MSAGHADRHRQHVVEVAPRFVQQLGEPLADPLQHDLGAVGDVDDLLTLGQGDAGQVADRQPPVPGAEVGGQDDADPLVEGERRRPPATARRARLRLLDEETGRQQHAEPLHDGRAREAGDVHDIGARERAALADEAQDPSGGRHGS
jgi:hypothetical protein